MKNMLKIRILCGMLGMSVGQLICVNHFIPTAQSIALQRAQMAERLRIRRAQAIREERAMMRQLRAAEAQTNAMMRGLTEEQIDHAVAVAQQRFAERGQVLGRRLEERRELRVEGMQRLLLQLPEDVRARAEELAQQAMEVERIAEVQQTMEIQERA